MCQSDLTDQRAAVGLWAPISNDGTTSSTNRVGRAFAVSPVRLYNTREGGKDKVVNKNSNK